MGLNPIRISIIEDSEIHIEWFKLELQGRHEYQIVSIDCGSSEGLESIKRLNPNIVILDFQLDGMSGLEVARRIKIHNPKIKTFAHTAHTEDSLLKKIAHDKNIDALAIKGSRYFEDNFLTAIKDIVDGGSYFEPSLAKKIFGVDNNSGLGELTRGEFEVFIQANMGKKDPDIAKNLNVELSHVRNLKSRIVKKINVDEAVIHELWIIPYTVFLVLQVMVWSLLLVKKGGISGGTKTWVSKLPFIQAAIMVSLSILLTGIFKNSIYSEWNLFVVSKNK